MDYQMLNSVWELQTKYERETRRLEDLKFFALPSAPPLDGMPHAPAQTSKVEKITMLIVEAEQMLITLTEQLEQQKYKLLSALKDIPMKELPKRVLNYHYVGCQSFNGIAKLLRYSRRYILTLHDEGLRALGLDVQQMIRYKKSLQFTNKDNQFMCISP